jgi:segregation and condensation protein A
MYKVRLQQFEGPLDLLLFFLRRDELDIHDIPIASIADEFLDYVKYMEEVDLDGVGDFLYMAAVLISIKAKMLLPGAEVDDEGEPIDPRQELVERLLEYIRFKEATEILDQKYEERSERHNRGVASAIDQAEFKGEEELVEATVFDLILALKRVLTDAPDEVYHAIEAESYTLQDQRAFLKSSLEVGKQQSFVEIVTGHSKPFIITTFLSILEMARLQEIDIFLGADPSDFFITLTGVNAEPEEDFEGIKATDE